MKAQTLKSNSVDDEKFKNLIRRIKTLDSQADEKLSDQLKVIKIFTAVRSFFGHWFHDERAVLQDLEKDVLRVESSEVFKKKAENLLIDVSESEVMKLQNKIEITNPNHSKVKLKDAEKGGYLPKKKFIYGDVSYYFSDPISMGQKHIGIFALVEIKGKVYPRVMYLSSSQGTWRVMPAMTKGVQICFGKGMMESDTQLPIPVMLAMNEIHIDEDRLKEFCGVIEYEKMSVLDNVETAYHLTDKWKEGVKIEKFIELEEGASYERAHNGMCVPNPETIKMPDDEKLHPDFSYGPIMEKSLTLLKYGHVKAKLFPSNDKSIQYLFFEVKKDDRVFLATVEKVTDNPIINYGVRSKALKLNNADAPLVEYFQQMPKAYRPKGEATVYNADEGLCLYRNNWNYVSKIPIIKKYYAEYKRCEMPGSV